MRKYENLQILGFDLGHGEFSLVRLFMTEEKNVEPKIVEINNEKKSQVTAIGYGPKNKIWIGNRAMRSDASKVEITFKAKPSSSNFKKETIELFCKGVIQSLIEGRKFGELDKNKYFFVGCPSGWNQAEKNKYQEIIASSMSEVSVFVVAESRAAFMHARMSDQFTNEDLREGVLVIDIGSSTTDFTFVVNDQDNAMDEGEDLGGALIDRAIFDLTLSQHPKKNQLEENFQKQKSLKARAEFLCRLAKEMYFREQDYYNHQPNVVISVGADTNLQNNIEFKPLLTSSIIQNILYEMELPELNDKTWVKVYRDTLQRVKDKIRSKGYSPKKILLTGGAARMKFTIDICEEVFPESKVINGDEPEFIVARGLARYGRIQILTEDFRNEAEKIVNEQLNKLVENNINTLTASLAESLSEQAVQSVILSELQEWNKGKFSSSDDLANSINTKLKTWFDSEEIDKVTIDKVNSYCQEIQNKINDFLNPICEKYNLPNGILGTTMFKFTYKPGVSSDFSKKSLAYSYTYLNDENAGLGFISGVGVGAGVGAGAAWLLGAFAGPIGWTALAVGAIGGIIGTATALTTETGVVEHKTLSDELIKSLLNQEKEKFKEKIRLSYDKDQEEIRSYLIKNLVFILDNSLKEKIDRARLLIP